MKRQSLVNAGDAVLRKPRYSYYVISLISSIIIYIVCHYNGQINKKCRPIVDAIHLQVCLKKTRSLVKHVFLSTTNNA